MFSVLDYWSLKCFAFLTTRMNSATFVLWSVLAKKSSFSPISKIFRSKSWYKTVWRMTQRTVQQSLSYFRTNSLQKQSRMITHSRFIQTGWRRKLLRLIEREIDLIWWNSNQANCLLPNKSLLRTSALLKSLLEKWLEGRTLFMKGLNKKAQISNRPNYEEFSLLTLKWMNWLRLIKIRGHL